MEWASKVINAATKASSNNAVISAVLGSAFVALSMRSLNQQRNIEALEAGKDSLLKSNKAMKKAIWDWKQQLYAEASSPDTALVPLAKLKSIYGEVPTTLQSNDEDDDQIVDKPLDEIVVATEIVATTEVISFDDAQISSDITKVPIGIIGLKSMPKSYVASMNFVFLTPKPLPQVGSFFVFFQYLQVLFSES